MLCLPNLRAQSRVLAHAGLIFSLVAGPLLSGAMVPVAAAAPCDSIVTCATGKAETVPTLTPRVNPPGCPSCLTAGSARPSIDWGTGASPRPDPWTGAGNGITAQAAE